MSLLGAMVEDVGSSLDSRIMQIKWKQGCIQSPSTLNQKDNDWAMTTVVVLKWWILIVLFAVLQGTVAYYLLLDNRFRASSGYLGAEFQESMVSYQIWDSPHFDVFQSAVIVILYSSLNEEAFVVNLEIA